MFGEGVGVEQFFYLYAGEGIGGAYVLDGQLVDGQHHITGEVGHMRLDLDGPICSCGNRGCLEALAGEKSLLRDYAVVDPQVVTLADLRKRLNERHEQAVRAYERAGEYIGIGVLNTIHLLNPRRILLGGPMFELAPNIVDQIKERVEHTALTALHVKPMSRWFRGVKNKEHSVRLSCDEQFISNDLMSRFYVLRTSRR
ncbi:ROK family protein [Exiguobacterium sp. SL14]|nr:ROK family protein [Exiguobacterium sp. SL14]MCY1692355.1 ROK family protein [Exiguobacterium sp. SL14]